MQKAIWSITEIVGQPTKFLIKPLGNTEPPSYMALDTSTEYVISEQHKKFQILGETQELVTRRRSE